MSVYIYNGGGWGEAFDPDSVFEETWGSATFVANSCDSISMSLVPNDTRV